MNVCVHSTAGMYHMTHVQGRARCRKSARHAAALHDDRPRGEHVCVCVHVLFCVHVLYLRTCVSVYYDSMIHDHDS